jgi:ATP-dependent Clp protease, protease subunit
MEKQAPRFAEKEGPMIERLIFVLGTIEEGLSENIMSALLEFNEGGDKDEDVTMFINSAGGACYTERAITDVMDYVSYDIQTVALGQCCSSAAMMFLNGTKGKRLMAPKSVLMVHPIYYESAGDYVKYLESRSKQINGLQQEDVRRIAAKSKLTEKKAKDLVEQETWLSPEAAVKLGLADGMWIGPKKRK